VSYVRRGSRRRRSRRIHSATSGTLSLRLWGRAPRTSGKRTRLEFGGKLVSGLVLVLLGLLVYYLFASPEFYVYDVKVTGAQNTSLEDVLEVSEVADVSVFYVRPEEVEARLETLRWVKNAEVRCRFPGRIDIALRERQAAFAWLRGGAVSAVDDQGVSLELKEAPSNVLQVHDHRTEEGGHTGSEEETLDRALIISVLTLRKMEPGVDRAGYDSALGLTFESARGYEVRLGEGRIAYKIGIWRALEAELLTLGIRPTYVDVRFPSSPSYGLPQSVGEDRVMARGTA
jgi:cell division septal protein FtsQ